MSNLPIYNRIYVGDNILTHQIVCNDGVIRQCRTEQFADGFHSYLIKADGTYTNNTGYKTVRKAINAAAKW